MNAIVSQPQPPIQVRQTHQLFIRVHNEALISVAMRFNLLSPETRADQLQ
jgi:hypothetical protein